MSKEHVKSHSTDDNELLKFKNPEQLTNKEHEYLRKLKNNPDLAKRFMKQDDFRDSLEKEVGGYLKRKNTVSDNEIVSIYKDICESVGMPSKSKEELVGGSSRNMESEIKPKMPVSGVEPSSQYEEGLANARARKGKIVPNNNPSHHQPIPEQSQVPFMTGEKPVQSAQPSNTVPNEPKVETKPVGIDLKEQYRDKINVDLAINAINKFRQENPNEMLGDEGKQWKKYGYGFKSSFGWGNELKNLQEFQRDYLKDNSNSGASQKQELPSSKVLDPKNAVDGKSQKEGSEKIETGNNKKYVDGLMKLDGVRGNLNRESAEKAVSMIRNYYEQLPGVSSKFSFADVLALVIVESEFNSKEISSAGCYGWFQVGHDSIGDMIPGKSKGARPNFYNQNFLESNLTHKKSYYPNNPSSWHNNNDNTVLGLGFLDGLNAGSILGKYCLDHSNFNKDGIHLKSGGKVSRESLRRDTAKTAEGKFGQGSSFDNALFDKIYDRVMTDENYRDKFNILYQYNSGIKYPFSVLYMSEKLFGGDTLSTASKTKTPESTIPSKNAIPLPSGTQSKSGEIPNSEPKAGETSQKKTGNEARETGGSKEYLISENTVVFGDSWVGGRGGGDIKTEKIPLGKKGVDEIKVGKNGYSYPGQSSNFIATKFGEFSSKNHGKLSGKNLVIQAGINNAEGDPIGPIDKMIALARSEGMNVIVCNYCTDHPSAKVVNAKFDFKEPGKGNRYKDIPGVKFVDLYKKVPGDTTNLHPTNKYTSIISLLSKEV